MVFKALRDMLDLAINVFDDWYRGHLVWTSALTYFSEISVDVDGHLWLNQFNSNTAETTNFICLLLLNFHFLNVCFMQITNVIII